MKIFKFLGGIIFFLGLVFIFVSKSPNYRNKSESIQYGIAFTIVGGLILGFANTKEGK